MASTCANFQIIGRLGQDPELHYTKDGQAVTNLSLAVDQGYGDNKRTEWVRVTIWAKPAEAAVQWLSKGDLISCTTDAFRINAYAAQDGSIRGQLEVSARRVDYLVTKRNPNEPPAQQDDEKVPF